MAKSLMIPIAHDWRWPKVVIGLLLFEFIMTIACLALYGIADPDTYRTKLWQNGADRGFNSSPDEILYSYANYKPISVPEIWSAYVTQFNVVIAVLSMFILLAKSTMFVLHTFFPLLSVLVHILLLALYATSIRNQSRPDMSDPLHPSPGLPWYLSKGCSYAEPGNHGYCMQARATYAATCIMVTLFAIYLILSIWNTIPTESEKAERAERDTDIEMSKVSTSDPEAELSERNRQMFSSLPKSPGHGLNNPMTPRTVAFTQLDGGSVSAESQKAGGRGLPFRQQFGERPLPDAR